MKLLIFARKLLVNNTLANNNTENLVNHQKGQTLIEFILLLSVLVGLSLTIQATFNFQIGKIWLKIVRVVVDDPQQKFDFQ